MNRDHVHAKLNQLAQLLQARLPGLIAIYRFGSYASADERLDSDIDLGLQAEHPLDPVALFHLAGELATLAGRDVDMITCSTVMRAQIVAYGEVIFCANRYLCEDFAATAFSRYAYINEARRGILEDIAQRGNIHG